MHFQVLLAKFKRGGSFLFFVCLSLMGGLFGFCLFLCQLSYAVTYNLARVCKMDAFLLANSCQRVPFFMILQLRSHTATYSHSASKLISLVFCQTMKLHFYTIRTAVYLLALYSVVRAYLAASASTIQS